MYTSSIKSILMNGTLEPYRLNLCTFNFTNGPAFSSENHEKDECKSELIKTRLDFK